MNVALVRDGVVENVIVVNSLAVLDDPAFADLTEGCELLDTADLHVGPGHWLDEDDVWREPGWTPPE